MVKGKDPIGSVLCIIPKYSYNAIHKTSQVNRINNLIIDKPLYRGSFPIPSSIVNYVAATPEEPFDSIRIKSKPHKFFNRQCRMKQDD